MMATVSIQLYEGSLGSEWSLKLLYLGGGVGIPKVRMIGLCMHVEDSCAKSFRFLGFLGFDYHANIIKTRRISIIIRHSHTTNPILPLP